MIPKLAATQKRTSQMTKLDPLKILVQRGLHRSMAVGANRRSKALLRLRHKLDEDGVLRVQRQYMDELIREWEAEGIDVEVAAIWRL
jgi:hypothetical protein